LQGELIIELALLLILFTISVMNNNFVTELLQPANALMRDLMAIIQNSELKNGTQKTRVLLIIRNLIILMISLIRLICVL